uniref:Immunoglobulin V-set domain-containing protein n=1 Tax=Labrus bergylta TaxID=56723 RepID=A0A3Q3L502_9LABR
VKQVYFSYEELTPVKNEESSSEGSTVTLSYSYPELSTGDYFFWYRQHPGKQPQLLVGHGASGTIGNALRSGLKISISSAALTDSAVYYSGDGFKCFKMACRER